MTAIEVKNVTKKFGNTLALDDVSLRFEENKIYALLGRNGAGKSTLLNIISNRIFPTEGTVELNGATLAENDSSLKNVYIMSENDYYPEKMKIKKIFEWTKTFYPAFDMAYATELAKRFELPLNKNTKSLSTGFNSIFKLIIALSVNVPFIFFDEPVLGLDANNRDLFYHLLLEKYAKEPFTAIISTHLIEEVSSVIEDIIIIKNGKIIKNESRESLLSKGYTVSGPAQAVDSYIAGLDVIGCDSLGGLKTAYIIGTVKPDTTGTLEITGLDLQKLFIQLTNA